MAAASGVGGTTDGSKLEGTLAFNKARRYRKYPEKAIKKMKKLAITTIDTPIF